MEMNEYVWVVESTATGRIDSVYGNVEAASHQQRLLGSEFAVDRYRVWERPTLGLMDGPGIRGEIGRRLRAKFGDPR